MIKTLSRSLRENKKPALLTLLFIVGEVFFEVLIPFYTADMVNMIKAGEPLGDVTALGAKLVVMAVLSLLCGAAAARTCADASTGFARNLRRDMFVRVQDFSFEKSCTRTNISSRRFRAKPVEASEPVRAARPPQISEATAISTNFPPRAETS